MVEGFPDKNILEKRIKKIVTIIMIIIIIIIIYSKNSTTTTNNKNNDKNRKIDLKNKVSIMSMSEKSSFKLFKEDKIISFF